MQTRKFSRKKKQQRGMTLVEIMVVITIIGLIMAAVAVAVIPNLQKAQRDRVYVDFGNISSALKLYYARKGSYPDTGAGLKALVDMQILEKAPEDPWGKPYVYLLENGKPVLMSYGADGNAGGEGTDADLSSKNPPPKD